MSFPDLFLYGTYYKICGLFFTRDAVVHSSGEKLTLGSFVNVVITLLVKIADASVPSSAAALVVVFNKYLCGKFSIPYLSEGSGQRCLFMSVCQPPSSYLTVNGTASGCAMRQRGPATSRLE